MPVTRIFQDIPLARGTVKLDEKASHHLARVLRAAIGDQVILFNGEGGEYLAEIIQVQKKAIEVEITEFYEREVESNVKLVLAQGVSRGEKMDFVIQKAVELGASEIYPLITERCNVRLNQERTTKRLEHWRAVMISACEQCGRNRLPTIHAPVELSDWVQQADTELKLVLSPHVEEALPQRAAQNPKSVAVLIGPEGGLSDLEVSMSAQQGFKPLRLGPRVLRTETAAVAALAVMQYQFGDY